jgi:hypothetical protein
MMSKRMGPVLKVNSSTAPPKCEEILVNPLQTASGDLRKLTAHFRVVTELL